MCFPISIGWQCFTDFPAFLQHPGIYLLALPSLSANGCCLTWRCRGFLWELLLLLPESPFLKVSQSHVQKGCSAGEAVFIPPQHFGIYLILRNHELWTYLQHWIQSRQLLDELPSR